MQEIPMQLHLMRSLKGAPISVLLVLWISRQPQSMRWIQRQTGYRDEAVQEALELLGEYHLVNRIGRYAWQFSGNTNQFPLGKAMLEDVCDEPAAEIVDTVEDLPLFKPTQKDSGKTGVPVEEGLVFAGTPEKPESDSGKTGVPRPSNTSSRSINLDSREDLLTTRDRPGEFPSRVAEVLEILDRYGIFEPKRSQLANMPGMTPRIALYHLTNCRDVALAIWRLERGKKVPDDWMPAVIELESPINPLLEEGLQIPEWQVEAFGWAISGMESHMSHSHFITWCAGLRLAGIESHPGKDTRNASSPVHPFASQGGQIITIGAATGQVIREMEPYREVLIRLLSSEFRTPVSINFVVQ